MLKEKKILMAHSNSGAHRRDWHQRRQKSANQIGYNLSIFAMTDYHPYTIFPYLERKWKRRDRKLMTMYDALGNAIEDCDIFIHYNGALIHPEFLEQFKKIKIYHCADDPDASKVISKPVAMYYDMCGISNPSCIQDYKNWGCKNVFYWPIGAYHFKDEMQYSESYMQKHDRDIPLVFVGSKWGVPSVRFVGKYLGLYRKRRFMERLEKSFPFIKGYGGHWAAGAINDEEIPGLYSRSQIGLNVHNSIGPVNSRMFDLAAFGVCQICDSKKTLDYAFQTGEEIVGFETLEECIDQISYYIERPDEARSIGENSQRRFLREYTIENIW
ncbi:MAG: glycosyltransferase, partial [Sediminibacterium sp.]